MNEQDYLKIMDGIDERFVSEYENLPTNRISPVRKRIRTVVLIAAAVAILVPASVFAISHLTHREKVSIYYNEEAVKKMEEELQASATSVENGQIRLDVDVQMCDGNFTQGVYTLTALTEEAEAHLSTMTNQLVYADTGEWVWPVGGGFEASVKETDVTNEVTWTFIYPVNNSYIDASRPIRLVFFEYTENGTTEGPWDSHADYTYYQDIYFDLITSPNVPTKTLRSKDGAVITVSPYGVSQLNENWAYPEEDVPDIPVESFSVISTDGERTDVLAIPVEARVTIGTIGSGNYTPMVEEGRFVLRFGTAFNLENISGVEINGIEYTE